jgi:hypothetical protein
MPDGRMDGHFLLDLNVPIPTEIKSILIYSADASGNPVGGQFWHTEATNYWMLGVFDQGTQLNYNHVATLGTFSGYVQFDLYGDDSGWFKKGNWFGLEVTLGDGTKLKELISIGENSDDISPTAIKIFSRMPETDSAVFKANRYPEVNVDVTSPGYYYPQFDRVPYHITAPYYGTFTVQPGQRIFLAGDATGTDSVYIDNFLLFEIESSQGTKRLSVGSMPSGIVSYNGNVLDQIGEWTPMKFDFPAGELDLTSYFPEGEQVNLKVSALDFGGVGELSDIYLLLQ